MERLTAQRCNGIKTGYWSPAKKDLLIERLAAYEDTGLEPHEVYELKAHRILNAYNPGMIHRWISVSESLPETKKFVLIIVSGKPRKNITLEHAVELAVYDPDEGWILEMYPEWCESEVIAWMPTPEPYKVNG